MKYKKNVIIIALLISSTLLSIASLTLTNSMGTSDFLPQPDPPNENIYWNFDNNTIIGYRVEIYNGTRLLQKMDYIFNISATKFYKNYSGMNCDYYGIELTSLFFNTSTNSLETQLDELGNPIIGNYSMVNFTNEDFKGVDFYSSPLIYINQFIPTNGSNGLLIDWCANRLIDDYAMFGLNVQNITTSSNTMRHENSITGEYVEAIYYNNGTLKTGEMHTNYGGFSSEFLTFNYTRIYDFNPLDDLEWTIDIGDIIYYGMLMDEYQIEIISFPNYTMEEIPLSFQFVVGNIYKWNYTDEIWEYNSTDIIAAANEAYPFIPWISLWEGHVPLLFPNGSRGEEMIPIMSMVGFRPPEFEIEYGDYWIKIINVSSGGYQYFESFANGLTKYVIWEDLGFESLCIYFKNSTKISGSYDFEIEPYHTDEFNVYVNISVLADTHLLFVGLDYNPTLVPLNNGLLFIDLFLNDTSNLGGSVNITIDYNPIKYGYIKLWYFNMSMNDHKGAWEQISFTQVDLNTLMVSVDHLSFFALSWVPYPGAFTLYENADDPDTDGKFKLWWDSSSNADSYSMYKSNNPILIFTGTETLVKSGIVDLEESITESTDGTYYYIVVASNEAGLALSNVVDVEVELSAEPTPEPPGNFTLSSNAGTPDDDGGFTLSWTASTGADNYTVYQYSGTITVINDSLTVLAEEVTNQTLDLTGYADGTYYFIVVAHNKFGDISSNYIIVVVEIEPTDGDGDGKPPIPGYDLYLVLILFVSLTAIISIKKCKKT